MKNNSQATNKPRFEEGDKVYVQIEGEEEDGIKFKIKQIVEIQWVSNEEGYLYRAGMYWSWKYDLLTKEQALLAFQEWLGKE